MSVEVSANSICFASNVMNILTRHNGFARHPMSWQRTLNIAHGVVVSVSWRPPPVGCPAIPTTVRHVCRHRGRSPFTVGARVFKFGGAIATLNCCSVIESTPTVSKWSESKTPIIAVVKRHLADSRRGILVRRCNVVSVASGALAGRSTPEVVDAELVDQVLTKSPMMS